MNRFDGLLLACALVFSAGLLFAQRFPAGIPATSVKISMDGIMLAELPLSQSGAYTARRGDDYVAVAVEGGAVFVSSASCRDQLCVKKGRVYAAGQGIVCLPNRVSVALTGGTDSPDAVLY